MIQCEWLKTLTRHKWRELFSSLHTKEFLVDSDVLSFFYVLNFDPPTNFFIEMFILKNLVWNCQLKISDGICAVQSMSDWPNCQKESMRDHFNLYLYNSSIMEIKVRKNFQSGFFLWTFWIHYTLNVLPLGQEVVKNCESVWGLCNFIHPIFVTCTSQTTDEWIHICQALKNGQNFAMQENDYCFFCGGSLTQWSFWIQD